MNHDQEKPEGKSRSEIEDTGQPPSGGAAASMDSITRLTRKVVASALKVSVASVRRMEERGELHPVTDSKGDHLHDSVEVENIRRLREVAVGGGAIPVNEPATGAANTTSTSGEIAARIFERLEKGEQLPAIVIAEKLDPPTVKRIAEQWRELKEVDLNSESVPRALAELKSCQSFDRGDLKRLMTVVQELVAAFRQLRGELNQLQDAVYGPPAR